MVLIARPQSREEMLRRAEQDMAWATTWISDSRRYIHEQKRLMLDFLAIRAQASAAYADALRLPEEAVEAAQPVAQGELWGPATALRERPQPSPGRSIPTRCPCPWQSQGQWH